MNDLVANPGKNLINIVKRFLDNLIYDECDINEFALKPKNSEEADNLFIETFTKYDRVLKTKDISFLIGKIIKSGNLVLFKFIHENYKLFIDIRRERDTALQYGSINILEWMIKKYPNGDVYISLKPTCDQIDFIAANGRIESLEWLVKNKIKFSYTEEAVNGAAGNGFINIIEFFDNLDPEIINTSYIHYIKATQNFLYNEEAIDMAVAGGHLNVVEWFYNSSHDLLWTNNVITHCIRSGHIDILEWFEKHKDEYDLEYESLTSEDFDRILEYGCKQSSIIWLIKNGKIKV